MLQIVKANDTDIHTIRTLALEIWPVTFGEILSKDQLKYMLDLMYSVDALQKHLATVNIEYYLANWNQIPVGFMCIQISKEPSKTKVHRIYILPNLQGKNIGKTLIDFACDRAKLFDNFFVYLNVNKYNPAIEFYKKLGFEVVKQEDIAIGKGYLMEDFVMEKSL